MQIIRRNTVEKVEKFYTTIDLKDNIQIEKLVTKTYWEDENGEEGELVSINIDRYYKNNQIGHGIIGLFDKSIKELHRQENIFQSNKDIIKKAYEYIDDVPFDLVLEKGDKWKEDFDLLIISSYDHTLKTLDNKELPKRIRFNYLNGITNEHFDLEKLLRHLKIIKSVELLSEIEYVPYYNNDDGNRKHIEFYLRPTDKEWNEILKKESRLYYQNDAIFKYYGFDKFSINEE